MSGRILGVQNIQIGDFSASGKVSVGGQLEMTVSGYNGEGTNPDLTDQASPVGFGPRRIMEPSITLGDLPELDVVVISHNHYDHLDKIRNRKIIHPYF